jgi:hypothetical protein
MVPTALVMAPVGLSRKLLPHDSHVLTKFRPNGELKWRSLLQALIREKLCTTFGSTGNYRSIL